jgi:Putative transposase
VLDVVYRLGVDGTPEFVEVVAPTDEELQAVLHKIITRTMKLLTRLGVLVEEHGQTYLADNDGDSDEARVLRPLQAAACTYRIAFCPRAGQKVLTVQRVMPRQTGFKQNLCADSSGFSLHAAVRCGADDRQALEQLCRCITRPALANDRVLHNAAAQVAPQHETPGGTPPLIWRWHLWISWDCDRTAGLWRANPPVLRPQWVVCCRSPLDCKCCEGPQAFR